MKQTAEVESKHFCNDTLSLDETYSATIDGTGETDAVCPCRIAI